MSRVEPVRRWGKRLRIWFRARAERVLRVLHEDLWTWRADPLPPSVWLRWFPHGIVCLAAFGVLLGDAAQLGDNGEVEPGFAFLIGVAQAGAMVLALWRPVAAWWLSMAGMLVGAFAVRAQMVPGGDEFHVALDGRRAHRAPVRDAAARPAGAHPGVRGSVDPHRATPPTPSRAWWVPRTTSRPVSSPSSCSRSSSSVGDRPARPPRGSRVGTGPADLPHRRGAAARRTLLEERGRIARELHDVVADHMSVISDQAQIAPGLVEDPPDERPENVWRRPSRTRWKRSPSCAAILGKLRLGTGTPEAAESAYEGGGWRRPARPRCPPSTGRRAGGEHP
ncbi:hypothetical protein STENM327S_05719 [Streptomyces tendae]